MSDSHSESPTPMAIFTTEQLLMLQGSQPAEKSIKDDVKTLLSLATYWVDNYNRQQTDDLYCTIDDAAAVILTIVASGSETYDSIDDAKNAVYMKIHEHVQAAKKVNPERLVEEMFDECVSEWEELDPVLIESLTIKTIQMITDIVKVSKGGITYTNCNLHRDTIWELAEQLCLTGAAL
jgi:hypothetical protein